MQRPKQADRKIARNPSKIHHNVPTVRMDITQAQVDLLNSFSHHEIEYYYECTFDTLRNAVTNPDIDGDQANRTWVLFALLSDLRALEKEYYLGAMYELKDKPGESPEHYVTT